MTYVWLSLFIVSNLVWLSIFRGYRKGVMEAIDDHMNTKHKETSDYGK